ncbi:MAG: hypothetical protein JSS68_14165 [Actinobacteria bacterium]|nr:hypothetical protein [Actinomycetota bacterium]MBS1884299.1 hypothetical protein [Actinomycetota bacterium]
MFQGDIEVITVEELLASARSTIRRFTPAEAKNAVDHGAVLIDIRPPEQRDRDGHLPDARVVGRNVLEWRIDPRSRHRDPDLVGHPVILICNQVYQSSLAAALLRRLGVDSGDVIGGFEAWQKDGLTLDWAT